ncbi:MAG: hypothetical protein H6669_00125 [Ardenticatenaceae bacterium]|nr:hypothetical protein [Ardenticatenaceae bacterium]
MINQDKQQINIKGIRDGLLVTLGSAGFQDMAAALLDELRQKQAFLQGSRVMIEAGQRPLTTTQLAELQALFTRHELELYAVLAEREETRVAARELGLATRLPGSNTDLNGNALPALQPANNAREAVLNSPGGLLLKETLRSGRSVYHEGPEVVVIWRRESRRRVIAGGDVIVWGPAAWFWFMQGALGDETAHLCPGHHFRNCASPTRSPFRPTTTAVALSPEQAIIRDGQIIAIPQQGK